MAINLSNLRAWGDLNQRIVTAVQGTAYPTDATTAWGAGWYDLGALSDAGVVESQTSQETKKYIWQGAQLGRVLRSQFEHPFVIECAEENAVTLGLSRPGTVVTTTGGTAEVQTITITGTPTAGSFPVTYAGLGTYTAAYNITPSALATALTALWGITVTVTGTASTSYVLTFPVSSGNVPQVTTSVSALTGATAISVATTTPGTNGVNSSVVGPFSGVNRRMFGMDFSDGGTLKVRFILTNAEGVMSGSVTRKADDLSTIPLTINPYFDAAIGGFFLDYNNDPARAAGLFV